MKLILTSTKYLSGNPILFLIVALMISCTKSSNNTASTTLNYCTGISWTSTAGNSGSFAGSLVSGQYELTGVTFHEEGHPQGTVNFTYDASGHLMNQPGLTVTYNQDVLVNYVVDLSYVSASTGTDTFTFNSNGQLTNVNVVGADDNGPLSLSSTYTYDSNGDPVHIVGHGSDIANNQVETVDYDITLNYLDDKLALLANVPIAAPFSVYFNTYGSILSKHLINQMTVSQTVTVGSQSEIVDLSPIFIYSYDANGRVATMKVTPPKNLPANVFTFTYSGCK